jgi:AraC family transcriptional regulator, regulatory protein of adaptative response / methylated-DNA-[protein]-cysteine methyltransferase
VNTTLLSKTIDTPLGPMTAIADQQGLYLLEFTDQPSIAREMVFLKKHLKTDIKTGESDLLNILTSEIARYFNNQLTHFKTPCHLIGTTFQTRVWNALCNIPYGHTHSYGEIARTLNYPTAYRAVAKANSTNRLAIIVPCHRVINANGQIGGYAGGITRKKWLLIHEKR